MKHRALEAGPLDVVGTGGRGVRGVGEAPIIPPLAAVASAIGSAIGAPVTKLPCSPMNVLATIRGRQHAAA